MTGQTLAHYRILEKLGEGGMGIVYKAEDTRLRRTVALKLLPAHLADQKDRFLREAQAAAALNHPNICTIHEVEEHHPFIAMEFLEGATLKDKIAQRPLPLTEALDIAIQTCHGLQHAHEKGIVHRDIKPANLMVTPSGQVKIMDFGLAQINDSTRITQTGASLGTPAYMSPEQVQAHPTGNRTDIWSLGATLHEMVAGVPPFAGTNNAALSYGIVHKHPEPVTALRTGLPKELDRIIAKTLAKHPKDRYQHADDLLADLAALRRDGVATATPSNRRYWLWASAGIACVSAGLFAPSVFRTAQPPRRRSTAPSRPSPNPQANEDFEGAIKALRVQYNVPRARILLESAIARDPQFAEAKAMYAVSHILLIDSGLSNDSAWLYRAEAEARELSLSATASTPHSVLAAAYYFQGRKERMPEEIKVALQLDPSDFGAVVWFSRYHSMSGNYAEATRLLYDLLDREPLFYVARNYLADIFRQQGRFDDALREADKVLDQDRTNLRAGIVGTLTHLAQGKLDAAASRLNALREADHQNFVYRLANALLLALRGNRAEALAAMDPEVLKFAQFINWTAMAAEFYAVLDDKVKSLEWLELAVRNGDERAEWFQRDPLLASIRELPRFKQILHLIQQRQKPQ